LADKLKSAWGRLRVHVGVALQPGYDGYLGVAVEMLAGGGGERKFQRALTTEIEAWREQQLGAEVLALPPALRSQAPVLPRYQRLEVFGGMGHSGRAAWPSPAVNMAPDNLRAMAA
jgi:hypothetical protein